MTRLSTAVAIVGLVMLAGSPSVAEVPGEEHSGNAAESSERHLVSEFVGATHEHGEDAFTVGAESVYGVAIGRKS